MLARYLTLASGSLSLPHITQHRRRWTGKLKFLWQNYVGVFGEAMISSYSSSVTPWPLLGGVIDDSLSTPRTTGSGVNTSRIRLTREGSTSWFSKQIFCLISTAPGNVKVPLPSWYIHSLLLFISKRLSTARSSLPIMCSALLLCSAISFSNSTSQGFSKARFILSSSWRRCSDLR